MGTLNIRAWLVVLLFAVSFCLGRENYNGFLDTISITSTLDSGTVAYSRCFNLSAMEDTRLVVKCDDTTVAGFAGDTVAVIFGYQTATVTLNSSGTRDTIYDDLIVIDTMLSSEYGTPGSGTVASSGVLTHTWGGADTSSVTGFATMSRWFVPEWDYLVRFYAEGMIENNQNTPLKLYFDIKYRDYSRYK